MCECNVKLFLVTWVAENSNGHKLKCVYLIEPKHKLYTGTKTVLVEIDFAICVIHKTTIIDGLLQEDSV